MRGNIVMEGILNAAGVNLLFAVICIFFGIRIMFTKDVSFLRNKNDIKPLKDEKKYAKTAGALILFFGVSNLVMAALLVINSQIAVPVMFACTAVLLFLWFDMNRKYGA